MWHWYIRPERCLASTWLLKLLVTLAEKAQVVHTWRRPPTSSKVTDICRFTRSLISAQKQISEPELSTLPFYVNTIFQLTCLSLFRDDTWKLHRCMKDHVWSLMRLHVITQSLRASGNMRTLVTWELQAIYVMGFNVITKISALARAVDFVTLNTLPDGAIELVHCFSHHWLH